MEPDQAEIGRVHYTEKLCIPARCDASRNWLSHYEPLLSSLTDAWSRWILVHRSSWKDIARPDIDAWALNGVLYCPGRGESVLQLTAEIAAFYAKLIHEQEAAILICHAGPIRLFTACPYALSLQAMALHAARIS